MDFETVFNTFHDAEADLVRSQLDAAGFDPIIEIEFATTGMTAPTSTGGIRVQVPTEQAADARALIESTFKAPAANAPGS